MSRASIGLLWALAFVILESIQFVYFGGLFQRLNSFLFGFLVLGLTTAAFIGYTALRAPDQLRLAFAHPRLLIAINLTAALAWIAFLGAVQLIEPAIAYTIGAGVMPLTALALYHLGWPEGEAMRNRPEAIGNLIIAVAMLFLAAITTLGYSGFVRGGAAGALAGIALAVADGVLFTLLLVYCQRLDRRGVRPLAVFGLRFPLYVATAGLLAAGSVSRPDLPGWAELSGIVLIGLALIIPPLYALQLAVARVSTLTLGAITATGPLAIFALQILEGRVLQSGPTLLGLTLYFTGAMIAVLGAVRGTRNPRPGD